MNSEICKESFYTSQEDVDINKIKVNLPDNASYFR